MSTLALFGTCMPHAHHLKLQDNLTDYLTPGIAKDVGDTGKKLEGRVM